MAPFLPASFFASSPANDDYHDRGAAAAAAASARHQDLLEESLASIKADDLFCLGRLPPSPSPARSYFPSSALATAAAAQQQHHHDMVETMGASHCNEAPPPPPTYCSGRITEERDALAEDSSCVGSGSCSDNAPAPPLFHCSRTTDATMPARGSSSFEAGSSWCAEPHQPQPQPHLWRRATMDNGGIVVAAAAPAAKANPTTLATATGPSKKRRRCQSAPGLAPAQRRHHHQKQQRTSSSTVRNFKFTARGSGSASATSQQGLAHESLKSSSSSSSSSPPSSKLHRACCNPEVTPQEVITILVTDTDAPTRSVTIIADAKGQNKAEATAEPGAGTKTNGTPGKVRNEPYMYPLNLALLHGASPDVIKVLVDAAPQVLGFEDGPMREGSLSVLLRHYNSVAGGDFLTKLADKMIFAYPRCVTMVDRRRNTALHVACTHHHRRSGSSSSSYLTVARHLVIVSPESLNAANLDGQTPVDLSRQHIASCDDDVATFLLSKQREQERQYQDDLF